MSKAWAHARSPGQCTPVYASARQCTPVYASVRQCTPVYASLCTRRQHRAGRAVVSQAWTHAHAGCPPGKATCSYVLCGHGSNRPCVEMALEGVSQCCSGARARRDTRCHWYGGLRRRLGACRAGATASPSHVTSERLPTAGSHRPCTAQIERCSGARARREPRCHWDGGLSQRRRERQRRRGRWRSRRARRRRAGRVWLAASASADVRRSQENHSQGCESKPSNILCEKLLHAGCVAYEIAPARTRPEGEQDGHGWRSAFRDCGSAGAAGCEG